MGANARPLPQLRGREQQLAQLSAGLHAVATSRRGKVLLLEAAAGAGKTRLLAEAAGIGERSGFTVVGTVPSCPDTAPRGVLVTAGAPPGAGPAAERLPRPSVSSAIEAARDRLRGDPKQPRTLVVLDDLHLANLPALTTLCDLVQALAARPVLWLLAFTADRDTDPYEPVRTCLGRLRGRLPVEPLRDLGPLSCEALTQLVTDCAGASPAPALLALAESVNTTPRAVIGLLRGLIEDGDVCVVDGIARLRSGPPSGAPVGARVRMPAPVPKRFSALIQKDLRTLSEPTTKALRLAAVLGSPFAPEDLSAMLGEAPVGLLAAVDEAVERGLLVCGEHDLAFRSEPIWRVLLDSVPPPVCALLRRQAARLLMPRPDGIAHAALQLVHVAQPGNVEELRIIAEGAQRLLAADPSAAAALAGRGMELLAPGDPERVRLARTAVEALTGEGDLGRAVTLAQDTIDETAALTTSPATVPGEDIAALRAAMSAALLLRGDAHLARRAAEEALAAQGGEVQYREAVLTQLAASCLTGDGTAAGRARQILDAPDRHPRAVRAGALTYQALGLWREGQVGDALTTLRKAVALDPECGDGQFVDPHWFLAFALTRTDEYEDAAAVVKCCARAAAGAGAPAAAVPAVLGAPLHLAQGRLDEAEQSALAGVGTDRGPHLPMLAPQARLVLGLVALRRGALGRAKEHLAVLERDFPREAAAPWWAGRQLLRAQLTEAQADSTAAADVLAGIVPDAELLCELVLEDPASAAWCVRCALAADRPGIVRAVLETTESLRARNRKVPAVAVAALHARALADGDANALAKAARTHRNPWARAAAAEDQAGVLLARGDQEGAIGELDRAMGAYGALGGERDAARVRAGLRGLGVRRRHWSHAKRPVSGWESLTKTERKVAELVAGGLTNRQAARHLFISPHTVGFHLRQIYRKLGIRSRTSLIRFMS